MGRARVTIRVRKILFTVHMDQLDADGNVIKELSTSEPITLYAHQLADLPAHVAAIVATAERQGDGGADPGPAAG
jgi:hypothetical protein